MFTTLKTAALSALIGITALAAVPAMADSPRHGGGRDHGPQVDIQIGGSSARYHRRNDWDDRWDRRCTPWQAVNKAQRLGLRRVQVIDVDRRTIRVSGRKHGDRVRLTFARAPYCPILRW